MICFLPDEDALGGVTQDGVNSHYFTLQGSALVKGNSLLPDKMPPGSVPSPDLGLRLWSGLPDVSDPLGSVLPLFLLENWLTPSLGNTDLLKASQPPPVLAV